MVNGNFLSARLARMAPAKIAAAIVAHVPESDAVSKVEVAGPGFINFYLNSAANNEVFRTIIEAGSDWGRCNVGEGLKTQVEFISANPVGPMHIGHGRWAALGDSLCNVMAHAGYDVEREYYIDVDMSKYIALLIDTLNHDYSISEYLDPTERIERVLRKYNQIS